MSYNEPTQPQLARYIALWTIGLVALVAVIGGVIWGIRVATADVKGRGDARIQIHSAASRISAYDHFFDLCASIQGLEGQLDAQIAELKTATGDDVQRVQANIAGIQGARAQAAAEYNADARKSYTIGQFKSSDLPYSLPDTYQKGHHTSCVV